MAAEFAFLGEVDKTGRPSIHPAHLERYRTLLQALAGKKFEMVLRRPRSKRSIEQNRWHFGIAVPMIAEAIGYDRHEYQQVHYALVSKCFGVRQDPKLGEVPNKRSSKLTVKEFSELMEWEVRFAATELGVVLPLPGEGE